MLVNSHCSCAVRIWFPRHSPNVTIDSKEHRTKVAATTVQMVVVPPDLQQK